MPRTGLSSEEIKEKAICAALQRIRSQGFDKVRLSDVARDTGVSHAALYAHFADKAALLDAVIGLWLVQSEDKLAAVIAMAGSPESRIVEWFVTLYRMKRERALSDPEPHRAFDMASAQDKPFVVQHLQNLLDQLAALFVEAGAASAAAQRYASLVFQATARFHHPTLVARTAQDDLEPQLRDVLALLLLGLRAEKVLK